MVHAIMGSFPPLVVRFAREPDLQRKPVIPIDVERRLLKYRREYRLKDPQINAVVGFYKRFIEVLRKKGGNLHSSELAGFVHRNYMVENNPRLVELIREGGKKLGLKFSPPWASSKTHKHLPKLTPQQKLLQRLDEFQAREEERERKALSAVRRPRQVRSAEPSVYRLVQEFAPTFES